MSFLAPSPPSPPPPAPVPTAEDPATSQAMDEARRKQQIAARLRQGRSATILTGGLGLGDPAPVARKTLLGE